MRKQVCQLTGNFVPYSALLSTKAPIGKFCMGGRSLLPKVAPSSSSWDHFGHTGWVGELCPQIPGLLEFIPLRNHHLHQIIRTKLGTRTQALRLAHQHYSIYTTSSSAENGPKSVSELKPDLGVASTFCPRCSAPHIVQT